MTLDELCDAIRDSELPGNTPVHILTAKGIRLELIHADHDHWQDAFVLGGGLELKR